MSNRIDDVDQLRLFRQQQAARTDNTLFPQPTPPANQNGENSSRFVELQQYGNGRRDQLNAAFAGINAGAVTAQRPFIADSRASRAYQQAYGVAAQQFRDFHRNHLQPLAESLRRADIAANPSAAQNGMSVYYERAAQQLRLDPAFRNVPMNATDVITRAGQAYRTELARMGFAPLDIPRPNPHRAVDFLQNYARDPNQPMTRLDPNILQNRVTTNAPTGDFFGRVYNNQYGYTPDAALSGGRRAWVSPFDELTGLRLNASESYGALGLSANAPISSQYMVVMNSSDYRAVPATWDEMIGNARNQSTVANSGFEAFAGKGDAFWNDIRSFDYRTEKTNFTQSGLRPDDFASQLDARDPGQGDIFLARQAMDTRLGVNEYFRGDGRVNYPDGTPSAREYAYGDDQISLVERASNNRYPELALTQMDAPTSGTLTPTRSPTALPVDQTPTIPHAPNTLRAETRNGAIAGSTFNFAVSSFRAFDDVRDGRRSTTDALLYVGRETGTGALMGGGSAALENYATRGVSSFMGGAARTGVGQIGRQALGSGIAGGIINGGISAYDQIGAYQRGEVSGARAIGTVVGETSVGLGAGMAGAAAGAAIGSIIPGAGTIVGGVIGFAVGVGVGMVTDWALRSGGVDQMIASGVESAIETGQQVVSDISEGVSNFASGAADRLSSIFG